MLLEGEHVQLGEDGRRRVIRRMRDPTPSAMACVGKRSCEGGDGMGAMKRAPPKQSASDGGASLTPYRVIAAELERVGRMESANENRSLKAPVENHRSLGRGERI